MSNFIKELENYLYEVVNEEIEGCLKAVNFDESKINRDEKGRFASKLVAKLEKMAKDLKKRKPIDDYLKKTGEIVKMKSSLPFKKGEIERVLSAASYKYTKNGELKQSITEEIYDEENKKYYIYKIYTKNGITKINKQVSKDETIFD